MIANKKTVLKSFGYTFYAFGLFTFLIYSRFPYDKLNTYLVNQLSNSFKKDISIKSTYPSLPAGIRLNRLKVKDSLNKDAKVILEAKKVKASANLATLFLPKKIFNIDIDAYGGNINGKIKLHKKNINGNITFENLKTEKYPVKELNNLFPQIITTLSGDSQVQLLLDGKKISKGTLDIELKGGALENLRVYGFKLPPVSYNGVKGKLNILNNSIKIQNIRLNSKDVEVIVKGDIILNPIIQNSRLKLNIKYKIFPVYMNSIGVPPGLLKGKKNSKGFSEIKISGNLKKPRFRF